MSENLAVARMAGPDKEDPVSADGIIDSKEIPVKASPPREKSPAATETDTAVSQGETTGGVGSVTPPDGGWGWFVVLASFMIHIIGEFHFLLIKSVEDKPLFQLTESPTPSVCSLLS